MQLIKNYLLLILIASAINLYSQSFANIDFEQSSAGTYTAANAVTGWTLSHQTTTGCPTSAVWTPGSPEFSIVNTPILLLPYIGNLLSSPLGGSTIVQLNDLNANSSRTRLTKDFVPTTSYSVVQFAFAGIVNSYSAHTCCEQAGFQIKLSNQQGVILCQSYTITPGCTSAFTFTQTNGVYHSSWQVRYFDLTPYLGTTLTLEVIANDCSCGLHYSTLYFDSSNNGISGSCLCGATGMPNVFVEMCSGSSSARLTAPTGYNAYSWSDSQGPIFTSTLQNFIMVTNPVVGAAYTVIITGQNDCQFPLTATIAATSLSIVTTRTDNSCPGGSSGSGTVVPMGSSTTYSYNWINSVGQNIGTSSVVTGLAPGNYSVSVMSSVGCGTAQSSVSVGTRSKLSHKIQPYCGNEAYLFAPPGSNYIWYLGTQSLSVYGGGTVSTISINNPTTTLKYSLTYDSGQGCNDSISYSLWPAPGGTAVVSYNKLICPGGTNGIAVVSMTPVIYGPPGNYSFQVTNSNTNTAAYNASVVSGVSNQFTVNNLQALGNYSVIAFDGACKYNTSFSVSAHIWNYTLTPSSVSVCSGANVPAGIQFPQNSGAGPCTYSWSPTTFLIAGNGSLQNTLITPTTTPGSTLATIYTVMVTPTISGCAISKTLQIVSASLLVPTITPLAPICKSSNNVTLIAVPAGGIFNGLNDQFVNSAGVISPGVVSAGNHTVTYTTHFATCSDSISLVITTVDFTMSLSGNQNLCEGKSTILSGKGATTYTWSNGGLSPAVLVSPSVTTTYSAKGFDLPTGCTNSASITVNIYTVPVISIAGATQICFGDTLKLMASGADSYTWNSISTGNSYSGLPIGSGIYFVKGENFPMFCNTTTSVNVKVNQLPDLSFTGTFVKCKGDKGLISVVGANSYTWNKNYEGPSFPVIFLQNENYTVTGTSSVGCSRSAVVSVSVDACTGTQENEMLDGIQIFPNPTSGVFSLKSYYDTEKTVLIYDATGKLIISEYNTSRELIFDFTSLPSGFYVVKFQVGETGKVIKVFKR